MHCTKNPWFFTGIWPFLVQSFPGFPRYTKNPLVFSQEFPSSENPRVFHRIFPPDATFPTFFHSFGPIAPGILGFLQDFPSSDAKVPTFFPHYTAPQILGFSQDFNLSYVFPLFWPLLRQEYWSDAKKIPTCACKHTTCTSRICKILQIFWPKTICVCQAFFTYSNQSARTYLCKAIFYIFGNYNPKQKFMYVIVLAEMLHFKFENNEVT